MSKRTRETRVSQAPSGNVFFDSCFARRARRKSPLPDVAQFLKEDQMEITDIAVAAFTDHQAAEAAVKKLAAGGFKMKDLSVVGKGYHSDEKVVGFYNAGDRIKFWGTRGAFWGGLWGLFFGGLFMTVPFFGPVVVLGYLATIMIAAIENAVVVGGLSAIGAAIYSMGVPKDSVIEYEADMKADKFLVMAHGTAEEVARAEAILAPIKPSRLELHTYVKPTEAVDQLIKPQDRFDHAMTP
jgi:hypothetical protein